MMHNATVVSLTVHTFIYLATFFFRMAERW